MKYRTFGLSSLKVSEIALGTMHFQWILSEKESFQLLDCYIEEGGNFIDTSDMYTQWVQGLRGGEAESILGKWFSSRKNREKIVLTSKVRARMWKGPDGEGLSRKHIIRACEESLKRLHTDYIDVYMSHWPDSETAIEETTLAYNDLVKQGKIRFLGLSNYSGQQLQEALDAAKTVGCQYSCTEPYYNLLQRNPFEKEILPLVKKYHLAVTPYSPLAGGFLSGWYDTDKKLPKTPRATFAKEKITPKNLVLLATLKGIAWRYEKTIAQVSLAWLLHYQWMTAPIVGPETKEQLIDNLTASDFMLNEKDIEKINKATKEN